MVLLEDGTEYQAVSGNNQQEKDQQGVTGTQSMSAVRAQVLNMHNVQELLQQSVSMPLVCVGHQEEHSLVETFEGYLAGFQGRIALLSLDIQAHPMLAQQLGYIKASVKLIMQGQILAEFSGQEPKEQILSLFERIVGPAADVETAEAVAGGDVAEWFSRIEQLRAQQQWQQAQACIAEALGLFPNEAELQLLPGHLLLDQQYIQAANDFFAELSIEIREGVGGQRFSARLRLVEFSSALPALPEQLEAPAIEVSEDDLWAQGLLACQQLRFEMAYERFIQLLQRRPDYCYAGHQDQSPKQALQSVLVLMAGHADIHRLRRRFFSLLH